MIKIVVKDELPRQLSYPIGGQHLSETLAENDEAEDLGLYFLYTSGAQVTHYDPLTSRSTSYPVLVADVDAPALWDSTYAMLSEEERRRTMPMTEKLAGVQRAEAQLLGADAKLRQPLPSSPRERVSLPPLSISIFPVKARLRRTVCDGIEFEAARALKNWLGSARSAAERPRPLVLVYDEATLAVRAKFADDAPDTRSPRIYR